ncbi:hypothetical protein SLS62_009434 [Diatrype stigma]|uniref:Alpha-type protein kinase domain-containing protein n=1 Tax=Diatrype stigma TaxID=117547 RepID=A0AAN9UEH3_9PEZI
MSRLLNSLICVPWLRPWSRTSKNLDAAGSEAAGKGLDLTAQVKAKRIVQELLRTHRLLKDLPDLRPGDDVNRILSGLVSLCSEIHGGEIVNMVFQDTQVQGILESLREMCSESEYLLEQHWAEKIIAEPNNDKALACLNQFPYYENYEDLTRLEISALLAADPVMPTRVAFIGSGPLPLTSLCFLSSLKSGALPGGHHVKPPYLVDRLEDPEVLNIDHNPAAIETASALIDKLGPLGHGMSFSLDSAGSQSCDLRRFDVVYLAALVGTTQSEKENLLTSVAANMREGALIVMRTSWGLRSCLYPEIDITTDNMLRNVKICSVVHPYDHVGNIFSTRRGEQLEGRYVEVNWVQIPPVDDFKAISAGASGSYGEHQTPSNTAFARAGRSHGALGQLHGHGGSVGIRDHTLSKNMRPLECNTFLYCGPASFTKAALDNPFSQGSFRWVAKGTYVSGPRRGEACVTKWFKTGAVFESDYFTLDIKAVDKALEIVNRFNELGIVNKKVKINVPSVWVFQEGTEWAGQHALSEPFIQNYQKFNSNTGWTDDSEAWGEVMQALSHFSYHVSGGQFVLCDLQGGIYQREIVLSDPVILSRNSDYGVTDLGPAGISSFFSQHSCNRYCRSNWTQPINPLRYFRPVAGTAMMRHSVATRDSRPAGTFYPG